MTTRADVVRVARTYKETPWHHRGRTPGLALDCAGVIVCAARELRLVDLDFDVPDYTRVPDGHTMIEWCREYMTPVPQERMQSGDVIVLITDTHPQHLGLLGDYRHGGLSIIHAANNAHPPRVIETRLMFTRRARYVRSFVLPGIEQCSS